MDGELGSGERRLADYLRRVNEVQQRAEETQAQLKTLRAQVASPDRAVSVEMAPGGRLERLTLSQQAMEYGPEQLAAVITETVRRGHAAVAEQMQETLQPLIGDSPAMEFLRDQFEVAQQDEPEAEEAPPAPESPLTAEPPPPPVRRDDDDGFDSVWGDRS